MFHCERPTFVFAAHVDNALHVHGTGKDRKISGSAVGDISTGVALVVKILLIRLRKLDRPWRMTQCRAVAPLL